jgi:hypothetical protein
VMRRRSAIKLRAYTTTPRLTEVLPPVKLINALPEWWSNLPAYRERPASGAEKTVVANMMTVKHCYGMQEVYKQGIGLRLWADVNVAIDRDGAVAAAGKNLQVGKAGTVHPEGQYSGAFGPGVQHFKFHSPWAFVCDEPIHFAWTHPCYHQRDPFRFHTMSALVEYKNQHSTNVNVLLPRTVGERSEHQFAAGEMMVYLFPMTERKVEVVAEEVTKEEMARINYAQQVSFRPLIFNRKMGVHPFRRRK